MNENCLCVLVVTKTANASVSVSVSGVGLGLDHAGLDRDQRDTATPNRQPIYLLPFQR